MTSNEQCQTRKNVLNLSLSVQDDHACQSQLQDDHAAGQGTLTYTVYVTVERPLA